LLFSLALYVLVQGCRSLGTETRTELRLSLTLAAIRLTSICASVHHFIESYSKETGGFKVNDTVKIKGCVGWEFYHVPHVDLHHPLAEGGSSYAVWETYDYTSKLVWEDDRIDWAVGYYYFDWKYRSDSDDIFAIRISATVEWYEQGPRGFRLCCLRVDPVAGQL